MEISSMEERFREAVEFFEKLHQAKLFRKPSEWAQENQIPIRDNRGFGLGIVKLIHRERKILDDKFTKEEFRSLMMEMRAYDLCVDIESFKNRLTNMLDFSKMRYRKEITKKTSVDLTSRTLGNIIDRINYKIYPINGLVGKKLQTQKTNHKKVEELFFLDFRNAIVHRRYQNNANSLIYGDSLKHVNLEELRQMTKMFSITQMGLDYVQSKLSDKPI